MIQLWPWLLLLWPLWLSRRPEAGRPQWMRRSLLLLLALLTVRYLYWRVTGSLNLATPLASVFSLLLLAAEAWLLLSGLVPLLLGWRRFDDGRAAADRAEAQWRSGAWRPWVDVLIPTCGEPLPVLERCLLGCTSLDYPHRTIWVLDDGGLPEVAALAAAHGCRYHHRPQRLHAKAGNLNAGLALGGGDLVAVFDADFVPQRHFLDRTIGLLLDPAVALVQTPQCFMNADPVLRNLELEPWLLPDEESFYRWIEPVRSAWGAVVCAGTSFVVRRSALDQIGGFVEGAISEDFVTGIALAARGWQLRYLGEKLSAGLAAETMLDFVRQRQRWAGGTLQALRLPQGPLRVKGLGWGQRLAYLEGALHWLNTLPRLALLLLPLGIGVLGVMPVRYSAMDLLSLLLPLWLALLLSVGWLNRGSRHVLLADLPGWATAIPLSTCVLQGIWGRHRSAAGLAPAPAPAAEWLQPGCHRPGPRHRGGNPQLALGLLWAGLNLLGLLVALRACWDRPCPDPTPWLGINVNVRLWGPEQQQLKGRLTALAETGADLVLPGPGPVGPGCRLVLDAGAGSLLPLDLAPLDLAPLYLAPLPAAGELLSVSWAGEARASVVELRRWLFSRPGAWPDRLAPPEWPALLALLRQLARRPVAPGPGRRSLVPQQLHPEPGHGPWPGPGDSGGR